ncbi:cytochrome ubiquinol oxidase subunit I [Roseibium sp. RKSG952]|uniref:cytochrome ubiquinol oxidase subunit I n=1 Tax=Roseibium sp. RKSG952 TaxID=2529384 RepID=UPI0012BB54BB|nr:cytochrome ubiquinol oxidase subunit I [Roseibium sp. RKSG952]MTH98245.1 cytochrome ubiquinol oxidase subunit I [Roseibium sp. RKSG952]
MEELLLSRIQFATNISFHILFPTITIALGWVLLFFKLRFNATGDERWMTAYQFWVKVFALAFGLGVVSGVTMSFQFGTNWSGYMEKVGNVAGPLLAYEILTAFFLEAAFLGIMLFGARKVPSWLHTLATVLVAFGTTLSAFWILVLNSWMQTPAGFEIRDGVVHATNWLEIIFNPSMPYRLVHVLLASGLTVAFLIAGVSAYRRLIGDRSEAVRLTFKTGIILAAILIPLQIVAGDQHGLNTLEYQPQKIAAMEGNWDTGPNKPWLLFAVPDAALKTNHYEFGVPNGTSLILKHDPDGVIPGLKDFYAEDGTALHPPVTPVFWSFRIMVGIGTLMLLVSWGTLVAMRRYKGIDNLSPWVFRGVLAMTFSGWIATLAGWYTTEIGRQPWLVEGVLKTKDAVSQVPAGMIATTLVAYLVIYIALISTFIAVLFGLARKYSKSDSQNDQKPTRLPDHGAAPAGPLLPAE